MTRDALNRLQRIDYLIRIKGTGSLGKLGKRLGLSRTSTYEYLKLMKEFGAPIKYCKYRETYYYDEEGSFVICFYAKGAIRLNNIEISNSTTPEVP